MKLKTLTVLLLTQHCFAQKKIRALLILCPFVGFAQKPNKLSFELGYGINAFSMKNLNQYYIDSFALKNKFLDKRISSGNHFFIGLTYRPRTLFDLGVYGNYQSGKTTGNSQVILTDDLGNPLGTTDVTAILKTDAIGVGVSNCWYISHFIKFHEKQNTLLNRLHVGLVLNAGIGFSKVSFDIRGSSIANISSYDYFTAKSFQGQVALKVEYDCIKSPVIGSIGIKVGYQYFKTQTVTDRQGKDWVMFANYPINLDFSGVFGAMYLSVGK